MWQVGLFRALVLSVISGSPGNWLEIPTLRLHSTTAESKSMTQQDFQVICAEINVWEALFYKVANLLSCCKLKWTQGVLTTTHTVASYIEKKKTVIKDIFRQFKKQINK